MSGYNVHWTIKELANISKKRVLNKFDANIIVTGGTGTGKCQPKGSKVLMADGSWKNIEDIKYGDYVLSPQKDGSHIYSKVIKTTKWFSKNNYDIIQKNKERKLLYSCSSNHTIPYLYRRTPWINGRRNYNLYKWTYKSATAEEFNKFADESLSHKKIGFSSFFIDKFKDRHNCYIEPYTLGVFLGDGSFSNKNCRSLNITTNDFNIIKYISKYYPIINVHSKKNTTAKMFRFSINSELAKQLTKYGLEGKNSGNKFIPKDALLSDGSYRKKLLAGLIDTDGYYSNGGYYFTLKSKKLIEDIKNLVYSLGGRTGEIKEVIKSIKNYGFKGKYYSISIYLKDLKLPLLCDRKIKKISSVYLDSNRIAIKSVKSKPCVVYGFSIKSPSKWYITDNWMVTHNSTFLWRFFHKFDDFKVKEKLVYSREDTIKLIRDCKLSYCWNDEMISSGNKRKFYDVEQIELIETLTKYRCNYNIFGGAVPVFFTLDKELLKLFGMHINIISRGIGVVHLPHSGRMFSDDPWDVKINQKLEEKWSKARQKNPDYKIPYHRYTTFAGYVFFTPLREKQEKYYEFLRDYKKGIIDKKGEEIEQQGQQNFYEKILDMLLEKKLDDEEFKKICLISGKNYTSVRARVNQLLRDKNNSGTMGSLLLKRKKFGIPNNLHSKINYQEYDIEPPQPKR